MIQTDEEKDHHHKDREGEPDEGYRPELGGIGGAEVLTEGVQGGEADLAAVGGDSADHVAVDLLKGHFQPKGLVQHDAAGVGAVQKGLALVDPVVALNERVFPLDLVLKLLVEVGVLLVVEEGHLNVVVEFLGHGGFRRVHIGLVAESHRPKSRGHDQSGEVEAYVFLPILGDALEGVFDIGGVQHRSDGGEDRNEPFQDPLDAGFSRHRETVLSGEMYIG